MPVLPPRVRRAFAVVGLALAGLLAAAVAEAADGTRRALLVGVSDYPKETVGDLQLAGPKNDVALMIDTVRRMGFADRETIVLADGLAETAAARAADGPPTRAAILAAFDRLAAASRPGDFVLLYFSGHGSQQPDLAPEKRPVPKPDGLEELFLPIDIGPWEDSVGSVRNALVDHELGRAVAAIRATGARVWVVVDACHSGTMTRSGGDGLPKKVDPAVLGIPAAALERARAAAAASAPPATRGRAGGARKVAEGWGFDRLPKAPAAPAAVSAAPATEPGGYVAFFAAWPDQLALQKNLPRGYGTGERRPHGVLTFYLAQALRSGNATTFRDLAHRVMAGYDQFGQAPTPMFEGDLGAVLPGVAGSGVLRWPLRVDAGRLTAAAGVVDGLAPGAVVAVSTVDEPATVRAHARVTAAGVAKADLEPIERDGRGWDPALDRESLLVTPVEKAADFALRVARPVLETGRPETAALAGALDDLAARRPAGIELVAPDAAADLRLHAVDGRLWFVADDAALVRDGRAKSPSLALPAAADAATVSRLLEKALAGFAKARNLVRIADLVGPGPLAASLDVETFVVIDDRRAAPGALAPDDRDCGRPDPTLLPAAARRLDPGEALPTLAHCDVVWFRLTNRGARPVDVTPLYVDGAGGVAYLGPTTEGIRLDPGGAPRLVPVPIVTWSWSRHAPLPIGREHMLLVMVEVEGREALQADFRYLAQAPVSSSVNRGAGRSHPLTALLEGASWGTARRGGSLPGGLGAAGIVDRPWRVVAPEGAP